GGGERSRAGIGATVPSLAPSPAAIAADVVPARNPRRPTPWSWSPTPYPPAPDSSEPCHRKGGFGASAVDAARGPGLTRDHADAHPALHRRPLDPPPDAPHHRRRVAPHPRGERAPPPRPPP